VWLLLLLPRGVRDVLLMHVLPASVEHWCCRPAGGWVGGRCVWGGG
jgi:hypothetical protein